MGKLLGAHVSAAGGPARAARNAARLGPLARIFAFFVQPRLSWKPAPPLAAAQVAEFRELLASRVQLAHVVVHGSYLINLGSRNATLRAKSVVLMLEEARKCEQLGVALYVFHPGPCKTQTRARTKSATAPADPAEGAAATRLESVEFVADGVATVLKATSSVALVLETMSGQGSTLGATFEELRAILDAVDARCRQAPSVRERVGVCLDTCHVFASGWEMDTGAKCDAMLAAFDTSMGPMWPHALKVLHVNDSKAACGSRIDRHANIGRGAMGLRAFRWLMNHKRFENVPMILETLRPKKTAAADSSGNRRQQKRKRPAKRKRACEDSDVVDEDSSTQAPVEQGAEGSERVPSAAEELALLHSLLETGA